MFFDDRRKHGLRHNPFKALVAPRPIAWVSSLSTDGVPNLAPFSYFNACADRPPTIMFAPNNPRPNGEGKDTLRNIEQTNEFVVNLAGYDLREPMNLTSAHVDASVDELGPAGLTPAPSVHVKAPRVEEAPVSLECRFLTRLRLPSDHSAIENNVVIGQVESILVTKAPMISVDCDTHRATLGLRWVQRTPRYAAEHCGFDFRARAANHRRRRRGPARGDGSSSAVKCGLGLN